MTGDSYWFSSLARAPGDEKITFGDASSGRVIAKGTVRINASFILKDVALVSKLQYNLLSVSQLTDDGFEVSFKKNACKILDSSASLVCGISRYGRIFRAVFAESSGDPLRCLVASESRCIGHSNCDRRMRSGNHLAVPAWSANKIFDHLEFRETANEIMAANSGQMVKSNMTKSPMPEREIAGLRSN